jgi:hypothetical protein
MSVSKYFLNKRAEEFQSHIRNTEDWPFMMKDPIFVSISTDCETVPMLELISRRNKLFENHRVKTPTQSAKATPEVPDVQEEPMDRSSLSNRSPGSDYDGSRRDSMTPNPRDMQHRDPNEGEYPESMKGSESDDYYEDEASPREAKREFKETSKRSQSPDSSHL